MLDSLLSGLFTGFGFMAGVLVIYTIYDFIFTLIAKRHEKAEAKKRKKRRH